MPLPIDPPHAYSAPMRAYTADTVRGTVTSVIVGVSTILMPASRLPHQFGYYAAFAAFLLGLRFGVRALGMLFACCVAIAVAEISGQGVCTPSSNSYKCGFEAAAPFLIFGYFIFPTAAGAMLGGLGRLSGVLRNSRPAAAPGPRDARALRPGRTVVVASAAAAVAGGVFAFLPLSGAPLFLPAIAACVAFGLAPSYRVEPAYPLPNRADVPSW